MNHVRWFGGKDRLFRLADQWAVSFADRMGVTIARAKPLDLRGCDTHPVEAWYRAGRYQPVLMEVPLSKLRGLGSAAFPCTRDSGHPFIETLLEYESGKTRSYAGSALERFYQRWQPRSAAECLGVGAPRRRSKLTELDAIEAVFPWNRHHPSVKREIVGHAVRLASRAAYGRILETNNRWHFFGPATAESGEQEYRRLVKAYASIKRTGYKRSNNADGDIRGVLLFRDDRWCVQIDGGGQHRSCAMSALGYTEVPVRLFYCPPMIVRPEECAYWPHVANGLFDPEGALSFFERVFSGKQPPLYCNGK